MEYGFELCCPESEVYSARVNNLCVPSTVLSNFMLQFNEEHRRRFKGSCFGHLMDLDKIQFSGQLVHGLALRRVARLGVKDMHGLSYAIGSKVVQFTAKDFCLISGLKFGVEPSIPSADGGVHQLLNRHFTNKNHITLHDIEKAFLNSKRGSEDCFKLGMLYFIEFVILGKAPIVRINEDYVHLVHNMEEFNNFPWGSISFEYLQDSLLFAPGKKDIDEKDHEKGKGQSKGKEEVKRAVKKRKKKVENEKRIRINRPAWSIKGLSFAFQVWAYELIPELEMAPLRYCKRKDEAELVPRICLWESTDKTPEFRKLNAYIFQSKEPLSLRLLRPSVREMQQNYWRWGSDFPEGDAPNIGPQLSRNLAEVNHVVQQLRDEIALLHHEKSEQWEKFVHFKDSTAHGMEVMRLELVALRKIIGDGGGNVVLPSFVMVTPMVKDDSIGGNESHGHQPENVVVNDKGELEYIPPEINWDDHALVCRTLVTFLQNPCRKRKISIEDDEADEDKNDVDDGVTVVQKKKVRGRGTTVQPAMKRPRSVLRETPWKGQEFPNIEDDTVGFTFDPLRPIPHDSLLKMAKFLWEWGQEEDSHVRLCGEEGVDASHDFFVRLLSKNGWLDDTNIDMGLYLVRERQKRYPNLVGSDWTIVDTLFQKYAAIDLKHMRLYGGKDDRPHSRALVKMVNGELHKWSKPWMSVKKVFLPYNCVRHKHWVTLALDLTTCEIFVYDSKLDLCRTPTLIKALQPVAKLIPMLLKEAGYVGGCPLQTTEWPVHRVTDVPQQVGGGDCGIFVLKYCEFLSSNVELMQLSADAIHLFRLKLAIDLLQGCCSI